MIPRQVSSSEHHEDKGGDFNEPIQGAREAPSRLFLSKKIETLVDLHLAHHQWQFAGHCQQLQLE